MGGLSLWHWLILIAIVALLFGGKGKLSGIMGDFAHGIRNFREGLKDPNAPPPPPEARVIPEGKGETVEGKKTEEKIG
jgi:sec-independent protein translocase protein TatA